MNRVLKSYNIKLIINFKRVKNNKNELFVDIFRDTNTQNLGNVKKNSNVCEKKFKIKFFFIR